MRSRFLSLLLVVALTATPGVRATSVVPPSFPELVAEAEAIYRGTVISIEARRVARPDNGSVIKTFVTFAIDRVLKGASQDEVVLEFLGGTVGDESLEVTGMPKFAVGQREFVFVQKNGTQLCPLVGLMHGRYRVLRDAAGVRDYVARDNGAPLTDPAEVELPMTPLPAQLRTARAVPAAADALTPAAFEAHVRAEVSSRAPAPQQK